MPTLIVYGSANDQNIFSQSTTYATARTGSGLNATGTSTLQAGQTFSSPNYFVYESVYEFDTSPLAGMTITAAVVELFLNQDQSTTDFTVELRLRDWGGGTATTADWVAGGSLAALPLLATIPTSGIGGTGSYKAFTDVALPANINTAGYTRFLACSSRTSAGSGTAPTAAEYVAFRGVELVAGTTDDPKITVTYASPVVHDLAGTTAGSSAATAASLDLPPKAVLAASSAGSSTASAGLALAVRAVLAGTSAGTSSSSASLSTLMESMEATANGSSAVTGNLATIKRLVAAAAGTSTATASLRVTAGLAGTSRGLSSALASLTTLPSTAHPLGIAIEFSPLGSTAWHAIECRAYGAGWQRGAPEDRGPYTVPEAGEATVYLYDPLRNLDPENTAGEYYGLIDVGARLRVSLTGAPAFLGTITAINHELTGGSGPMRLLAVIRATDDVAYMSSAGAASGTTFPAQATSARISAILDLVGVAVGTRDIEAGGQNLIAGALDSDAWTALVATVHNELGSFELRPDGTAVSNLRATVWQTFGAPVDLELGCAPGALPIEATNLATVRDTVRNRVAAAREGGSTLIRNNVTSQTKYGLRSTSRTDLQVTTDAAVDSWAVFMLARSGVPRRGYEGVAVRIAEPAQVALIEGVPLFTGRVRLTIDDYGAPIDVTLRLVGVAWEIDDVGGVATLSLGLAPVATTGARTVVFDSAAQWLGGLGAASGTVLWQVEAAGTLRVGPVSAPSVGGISSLALAWTALE